MTGKDDSLSLILPACKTKLKRGMWSIEATTEVCVGALSAVEGKVGIENILRVAQSSLVGHGIVVVHQGDGSWGVAADHLGGTLLYQQGERLALSARTLASLGDKVRIDDSLLGFYLAYSALPGDRGPYVGINKVPAGHGVVAESQSSTLRVADLRRFDTSGIAADRLDTSLSSSLTALGAFDVALSGGVDSSLLYAMAFELKRRPRGLAVQFPDGRQEQAFREIVAGHVGGRLLVNERAGQEPLAAFRELVECLPEPVGHHIGVSYVYAARWAEACGAVSVVTGAGAGDMTTLERYVTVEADGQMAALPFCLSQQALLGAMPLDMRIALARDQERTSALTASGVDDDVRTVLTNCFFCFGRVNLVPEFYCYHRHGVRLVTPFASSDLLGVSAASAPAGTNRAGKWLIREAARHRLPAAIAERPSMGFSSPVPKWLRGAWEPVCRAMLNEPNGTLPPWAIALGLELLEKHQKMDHPKGYAWPLFALMVWIDWFSYHAQGAHHPAVVGGGLDRLDGRLDPLTSGLTGAVRMD